MRILIATFTAAVVLSACGGESPVAAPVAAAPPKKAAPKAETVAAATGPAYVYQFSPIGKRDPFRSPVEETRRADGEQVSSCTEALCQWDLDQLVLVAVVTGDANPIAMVEDPQGRGFVVRRNTKMGKQGGKVTNILRESITVTEYWQGPDGKVNPNPVSIKLKPDAQLVPTMDLSTGKFMQ